MLSDFIIKKAEASGDENAARAKVGKISGVIGIALNTLLFAGKLAVGIIMRSVSVIADAINNLSDASSNAITFIGFKMAARPADKEHPYGHGRYEYLAALFIAVIILVIGIELLKTSIEKIISPVATQFKWITVGILCAAIVVKLWMCIFNYRLGRKINSTALLAASADSRNDVITTSVILASAIITHYTGVELDGYMGAAVALFILYSGIMMVKDTIDPLLGRAPDKEFTESIRERILSYEGVTGTHDLMVHDYGIGRMFASVHVEMPAEIGIIQCHEIIDRIERDFLESDGLHLVVHLDPVDAADADGKLRERIEDCAKNIDKRLTVHDLNVSREGCKLRLIFDCVAPEDLDADETKYKLIKAVKEEIGDCDCEINIDTDYTCIMK